LSMASGSSSITSINEYQKIGELQICDHSFAYEPCVSNSNFQTHLLLHYLQKRLAAAWTFSLSSRAVITLFFSKFSSL